MPPQWWSRGQKSPEKETFQASSFTAAHTPATTEQTHFDGNVLNRLAERAVGSSSCIRSVYWHGSGDSSIGGDTYSVMVHQREQHWHYQPCMLRGYFVVSPSSGGLHLRSKKVREGGALGFQGLGIGLGSEDMIDTRIHALTHSLTPSLSKVIPVFEVRYQ